MISSHIEDIQQPQCTLVFDREAYEQAFFHSLWKYYCISVLTYRKNVKDKWDKECFESSEIQLMNTSVNMNICECETEFGGYTIREVRRLSVI